MKKLALVALLAVGFVGSVNADLLFKMDFNGDARTDFAILSASTGAISGNVYSSTGSAFSLAAVTSTSTAIKGQRFFYGDFNGDGRTEIGRMWNDNNAASIEISTVGATALTPTRWATQQGAFAYDQLWMSGDFSGDGKTDIAKVYNNAGVAAIDVYVAAATGTTFTNSNWLADGGGNIDGQRFVVGHFSNANRMDVAKIWNNNGKFAVTVYESNGTAFTPSTYLDTAGAFDCQWMVGDFNGDRLTDIVKYYSDTLNRRFSAEVYLAGTKPMTRSVWANQQGAFHEDQIWLTGDFTGDGRDDLAKIWKSRGRLSISVHASSGTAFAESAWLIEGDNYYDMQKWMVGDFDADGKKDLARVWSDNGMLTATVFRSTGTFFIPQAWATRSGAYVYGRKLLIPKVNDNGRVEGCIPASATAATNRTTLQNVLNSGGDCILCQQDVYPIDTTIHYGASGQALYTEDAENVPLYATIRTTNRANLIALWGEGRDFIRLENVIVDGNRYRIGANDFVNGEKALMQFANGKYQLIQHNVIMSTRSWSTLQLIENRNDAYNTIRENLILGAGPDGRGNGVSTNENQTKKGHWADAMTLGAARTHSVNNLFMDPTDVGTAIFSACGSILEDNVVTSMSREALGAFDMVDGIPYYCVDSTVTPRIYTFDGTIVRNNYFDAFGSRIDMGLGMGTRVWIPGTLTKVLRGATIINNTISGNAFGYGFPLTGVINFTVTGNVSRAQCTGKGDGTATPSNLDDPLPFQYDASNLTTAQFATNVLQPEYVRCTNPLQHLLRCNRGPFMVNGNSGTFVAVLYTNTEAAAIVNAAFVEMLHRTPTAAELTQYTTNFLQIVNNARNLNTADSLRRILMQTTEFRNAFGTIANTKDALQLYRISMWQTVLSDRISAYVNQNGSYPPIKGIYQNILNTWSGNKSLQLLAPAGNVFLPLNVPATISWSSSGSIANVKIDYSTDGGTTWIPVAASVPNNGTYQWTVPNVKTTRGALRITEVGGTVSDQTVIGFVIDAVGARHLSGSLQQKQYYFSILGNRTVYAYNTGKLKTVRIYNLKGAVVKEIPVNSYRTIWDGKSNRGCRVPNGVYTIQLIGDAANTYYTVSMVHRGR
jgi:hypothetical protein